MFVLHLQPFLQRSLHNTSVFRFLFYSQHGDLNPASIWKQIGASSTAGVDG